MEKLYYDLHIHSCLSPCGDREMTPANIVNMACLKGLDVIAVTDHNAFLNGKAAAEYAASSAGTFVDSGVDVCEEMKKNGRRELPLVLFGAEVETLEEVHVLCLFARISEAKRFFSRLVPLLSQMENDVAIFGEQLILDAQDQVTGREERLLATAAEISLGELFELTEECGGAFVPAHIDKEAFSVLASLGGLPGEIPFRTVEVSQRGVENGFLEANQELLAEYQVICSSDAHYLWEIAEAKRFLMLPDRSAEAVIRCLRGKA